MLKEESIKVSRTTRTNSVLILILMEHAQRVKDNGGIYLHHKS